MRLSPDRGGFGRAIGVGEFVRLFLAGRLDAPVIDPVTRAIVRFVRASPVVGAPQQDIWARYKDYLLVDWAREFVERWRDEGRLVPTDAAGIEAVERIARARISRRRGMKLSSFYRYFRTFVQLDWVKLTGHEEDSVPGGSPGGREIPWPRRFYRLTLLGMAERPDGGWRNALRVLHPEFDDEYFQEKAREMKERRGRLPPFPESGARGDRGE
ncbi:MAG: hypothetical protein O2884_11760 [Chloroflexi bacterium]|nr:hypothetical protein [Chloroflexota bacterium]